jgi:hypothetical protein
MKKGKKGYREEKNESNKKQISNKYKKTPEDRDQMLKPTLCLSYSDPLINKH